MEFPEYVPEVVRSYISNVLDGEAPRHITGYRDLLARAEEQLYSINAQFDNAVSQDDSYLSELRKKGAKLKSIVTIYHQMWSAFKGWLVIRG